MTYSQAFIDKHREFNVDYDWWDCVYADFATICDILGIELADHEPRFSGFWSQGDGASWAGSYNACKLVDKYTRLEPTYDLAPQKIREHAPKDTTLHSIADQLCLLARIYEPVCADIGRRHGRSYVHENTMTLSEWVYWNGKEVDDVDEEIQEHIEHTLMEQFRALAGWLYSTLEKEYDYLTSDEAVIEALEANEIEEEIAA